MHSVFRWLTALGLLVLALPVHGASGSSAPNATDDTAQHLAPTPGPSSAKKESTAAEKALTDAYNQALAHDHGPSLLVEAALHDCYVTNSDQCNAAIDLYNRKWRQEFTQRSYQWHLFSTKVIFYLVISIVVFGLYITYVQFNRDYHNWSPASQHTPVAATGPTESSPPLEAGAPRPISTFKLGAGGLELSSQVIGLIVLALSFGFFYEYLKDVYPMVENSTTRAALPSPSAKD